ncbi:MAG: hypothetical protein P4L22_03770 [Candidatus Babeliales bacterium]|nr:hypothetical protein [Candidatus Babeliales bacterium]
MKFIKIMLISVFLSIGLVHARLIVHVDAVEIQKLIKNFSFSTIISMPLDNGKNLYIFAIAGEPFYYRYIGASDFHLQFPRNQGGKIVEATAIQTENDTYLGNIAPGGALR